MSLKPCDTIVIDAMANSAYIGTDENGLPMPPAKSSEDGRYHMLGDLQLAPTGIFKTNLNGHGNEADFLGFLQKLDPHRSLTLPFEPFRFWLRIRGDFRN